MELTIARCEPERLPDVGRFFRKQYTGRGEYGSLSLFHWKIRENYLGTGFVNLAREGDTIAATTSITGKRVFVHGSPLAAAEIGDTYTDASYQRRGLFSTLVNQSRSDAEAAGIRFIYGTPNHQSLPGYQKNARFDVVPALNVAAWVFPVNVDRLLRRRMFAFPAAVAAAFGELALNGWFRFKRARAGRPDDIEVRVESDVPDGWNEFWISASREHDFILDRSREAISWRFFQSPHAYRVVTLRKGGSIVGYVSSRWVSDASYGTQLLIADFLTTKGDEDALTPALAELIAEAFDVGATVVSAWLPSESRLARSLERIGFRRRGSIPVIAYMNEAFEAAKTVTTPHFSMADSDNV